MGVLLEPLQNPREYPRESQSFFLRGELEGGNPNPTLSPAKAGQGWPSPAKPGQGWPRPFSIFCNPYHRFVIFCSPYHKFALLGSIFATPITDLPFWAPFLQPLSQIWLSGLHFCNPYHRFGSLGSIFVTPITDLPFWAPFLQPL